VTSNTRLLLTQSITKLATNP